MCETPLPLHVHSPTSTYLRVDWVAVMKALRARRANRWRRCARRSDIGVNQYNRVVILLEPVQRRS
eukprot:SAG25_NODE_11459_length_303_cov_1.818627_1_plen_65_part_01